MVPPVPIPNTVVKHSYAESTCLETDWEDRALPVKLKAPVRVLFSYTIAGIFLSKWNYLNEARDDVRITKQREDFLWD